jgi:hypothetical protein
MASQIAVNMNFCTVSMHKCRAGYVEVTELEITTKDIVIL